MQLLTEKGEYAVSTVNQDSLQQVTVNARTVPIKVRHHLIAKRDKRLAQKTTNSGLQGFKC
jgi:hypothetical protein